MIVGVGQWRRVPPPKGMVEIFPNARCWQREAEDGGHLTVFRTMEPDGRGRWRTHISISHRWDVDLTPGRYPTWDEQKEAVWRFAPGRPMVSYLPAQDEPYVNVHETTFHWWEALDEDR